MITVKYEDDNTGQTATFSITPSSDKTASIEIDFDPPGKADMKDPYGILGKLAFLFTGEK